MTSSNTNEATDPGTCRERHRKGGSKSSKFNSYTDKSLFTFQEGTEEAERVASKKASEDGDRTS